MSHVQEETALLGPLLAKDLESKVCQVLLPALRGMHAESFCKTTMCLDAIAQRVQQAETTIEQLLQSNSQGVVLKVEGQLVEQDERERIACFEDALEDTQIEYGNGPYSHESLARGKLETTAAVGEDLWDSLFAPDFPRGSARGRMEVQPQAGVGDFRSFDSHFGSEEIEGVSVWGSCGYPAASGASSGIDPWPGGREAGDSFEPQLCTRKMKKKRNS